MMILSMWVIFIFMCMIGNLIFVSKYKHLLVVLLSLEFIVLGCFFFMLVFLSTIDCDMYMLLVFLVFTVCEGVLGLSILVAMIRSHGNDYFQSFSLL